MKYLRAAAADKSLSGAQVFGALRRDLPDWPSSIIEWLGQNYFWGIEGRPKPGTHIRAAAEARKAREAAAKDKEGW